MVSGPLLWIQVRYPRIHKSNDPACRGNSHGSATTEDCPWLAIESRNQRLQQMRVGIVVRLRNPNILSSRQPHAFVPLLERTPRVFLVELHSHSGIGGILAKNRLALVGGAVVQQDQLEILKRLSQHAIDPLPQKARVVIVRDNDANGGHAGRSASPESPSFAF